jgi:multidrug resistance efflux pump
MKSLVKIVAPVILVLTAATAVAVAAPVPPKAPYPDVPANADVCKVEKLEIQKQQAKYDQAKGDYDRTVALYQRGAASIETLEKAEAALHNAELALNNAKYAEAACRNKAGDLSLELNRLIDELAIRKELERLARNAYDRALNLARTGSISAEELAAAKTAWQVAVIERQQVEQKITDQRAAIAANPACRDYPSERPTPTSTTPTTPTSPSPTTPTSPSPTTPSPTSTMPTP